MPCAERRVRCVREHTMDLGRFEISLDVKDMARLASPPSSPAQQPELLAHAGQFFDEFVEAFKTFDGSTIAERYVAPYLAMHMSGAAEVFGSSADIGAYFQGIVNGYHARGCRSCRYRELSVVPIGRESAIATVIWDLLAADGAALETWRESYNLYRVDGRYRIYASTDLVG